MQLPLQERHNSSEGQSTGNPISRESNMNVSEINVVVLKFQNWSNILAVNKLRITEGFVKLKHQKKYMSGKGPGNL